MKDACALKPAAGDAARADRRVARGLALCCFLVYSLFSSAHFDGSDEITVFGTAESIWERGELALRYGGAHVFQGADGRDYGHFAIGHSVLQIPFYGLGKLIRQALPESWAIALAGPTILTAKGARGGGTLEIVAVKLYGPFASAVLVALFFVYERRLGVSLRNAVLASALLGFTTYVAAMSGYVLRHTTETVVILGALYAFDAYHRSGRLYALGVGSTLTSLLLLVSVPAAIAGPALGVYLLWVLRARVLAGGGLQRVGAVCAVVALPVIVAICIHIAVNHAVWGMWLDNPMLAQRKTFTAPFYVGASGLLFSPGGSIFAYSPLLLLGPWTLRRFWRTHRAECVLVLAISLTFLVVHSTFWSWTGLWSAPGPRYMFVATPLLMLALGPWLDGGLSPRTWWCVAVLAGVGALVQIAVLAARWVYVIQVMDYRKWAPEMEFMFIPSQSPILACAKTLAAGKCDPWLCRLYDGWPGFEAQPFAVVAVLLVWSLGFAISLRLLRRAYDAHPLAPAHM